MLYSDTDCASSRIADINLTVRIHIFSYAGWNVLMAGFIAGFGLLFEPAGRRTELALFFLPRFLEGFWAFCAKRQWVSAMPHGQVFLLCIAMAIIMYCYQNEPENIKRNNLSIFKKFWGDN